MVNVPVVVTIPAAVGLACVEELAVVTTTPMKGAAFKDSAGEVVVPSFPSVLTGLSALVLVVSPAEYNVLVIVIVGDLSEGVFDMTPSNTATLSELVPIELSEH